MKRLWNPEYGSRKTGIPLMIGIGNPSSTDKGSGIQHLETGIQGVESRIQDLLDFLTLVEKKEHEFRIAYLPS